MSSASSSFVWKEQQANTGDVDAQQTKKRRAPGPKSVPAIPISDLYLTTHKETTDDRVRKLAKANPLIPLGLLSTVAALGGMIYSFMKNDSHKLNRYARYRIAAQGFTVVAFLAGMGISAKLVTSELEKIDKN